jgi:glycosyltransferase involved in cell wall biosynthesis
MLDGIEVWRVAFVPVYPLHVHIHSYFANRLLRQLEAQFDVINAHTPLPAVLNSSLPMVTTVHSPMRSDTAAMVGLDLFTLLVRLQNPFSQHIEATLFRRSRRITAVAQWVAKDLAPYGVEDDEVVITGNGVEACFFAERGSAERKPLVVYTGRLEPGKGLEELVESAATVVGALQNCDLRFVIVGKGSLEGKLRSMVARAGLAEHFEFKGFMGSEQRAQLVALYHQASVFVLPSHHEGMPTALLEAMATGLPVVSTAVGGAREVIVNRENGLLVEPREPEQLAEGIRQLMECPDLRHRIGENGRQTVMEQFSWDAVVDRYLSCFERTLNRAEPR